jgi:hypothetical protein
VRERKAKVDYHATGRAESVPHAQVVTASSRVLPLGPHALFTCVADPTAERRRGFCPG